MIDYRIYGKYINRLIEQGLSLYPVKGKEWGEKYKQPFGKPSNVPKYDAVGFFDIMDMNNTDCMAVRTGSQSEGVICIDVDSKYKLGFGEVLLKDLSGLWAGVFEKMLVEKTPSGGYHLYIRVAGEAIGSGKLASRPSTMEELALSKEKKKCFLEIRGEGNLSQCYPSPDYTLVYDRPIGTIDREEWDGLLMFLRSYDEVPVEEVVKIRATKDDKMYSLSPWEDFNNGLEAPEVLADNGWTLIRSVGSFDQYKKPGKKDNEVSAVYNHKTGLYTIHTTSTELENKTYNPASLKRLLEFGGDGGRFYQWLVDNKYGQYRKEVELSKIIAAAKKGVDPPANISLEGKKEYEEVKVKLKEQYPYGLFWETTDSGYIEINKHRFLSVCREIGFRKYKNECVLLDGHLIKSIEEQDFYNRMKSYIDAEKEGDKVLGAYETFVQKSGSFSISRLDKLDHTIVLSSTKYVSYKFFSNLYLRITKDSVEELSYDSLDMVIWERQIQKRDFIRNEEYRKSIFWDFLGKATPFDNHVMKCLGFLYHDYKDEQAYFILTTEQCENPKDGGGSGKNVLWNLTKLTTTLKNKPAAVMKLDEQMMQSWRGERVYCFSDLPRKFDFETLKEPINGEGIMKQLHKDVYEIPVYDMPKFGGSTNFSYDDSDNGVGRRIRTIEFTNYFTLRGDGSISREYAGKMFPIDWDENDFSGFDGCVIHFIQEYLRGDCVINKPKMTSGGWVKQFKQMYTYLFEFINEHIEKWVSEGELMTREFQNEHESFCKENGIRHTRSYPSINDALKSYCEHYGYGFSANHLGSKGGVRVRCRKFWKDIHEEKVEEIKWHSASEWKDEETPF